MDNETTNTSSENGQAQQNQPEQPVTPSPAPPFDPKDIAENKVVAALSYLGILFLAPLLLKKESKYSQFHAKQGIVLFIGFLIGSFFFWIPIIGWAVGVFLLVVDILALVKTLNGEAWEIPVVKDVVKSLNI